MDALLDERTVVVDLEGDWLRAAEMLLMGVPGPLRASLSFSAGLRFARSRGHQLTVFAETMGKMESARPVGESSSSRRPASPRPMCRTRPGTG